MLINVSFFKSKIKRVLTHLLYRDLVITFQPLPLLNNKYVVIVIKFN